MLVSKHTITVHHDTTRLSPLLTLYLLAHILSLPSILDLSQSLIHYFLDFLLLPSLFLLLLLLLFHLFLLLFLFFLLLLLLVLLLSLLLFSVFILSLSTSGFHYLFLFQSFNLASCLVHLFLLLAHASK